MNKSSTKKSKANIILTILSFVIVILLFWSGSRSLRQQKAIFDQMNKNTEQTQATTKNRLQEALLTLPDNENTMVGLKEAKGTYTVPGTTKKASIVLDIQNFKTTYVPGIYKQKNGRVDAIVPVVVSGDSQGGSLYLVLFNDRGDVVLEKSHARLGDDKSVIKSIAIMPPEYGTEQEYNVSIVYTVANETNARNIVIPVSSGFFDGDNSSGNPVELQ